MAGTLVLWVPGSERASNLSVDQGERVSAEGHTSAFLKGFTLSDAWPFQQIQTWGQLPHWANMLGTRDLEHPAHSPSAKLVEDMGLPPIGQAGISQTSRTLAILWYSFSRWVRPGAHKQGTRLSYFLCSKRRHYSWSWLEPRGFNFLPEIKSNRITEKTRTPGSPTSVAGKSAVSAITTCFFCTRLFSPSLMQDAISKGWEWIG